ncbi:unnamed protein product [Sphagnum jensenii]|uniref:Uncharacterized protein n=1 Tax=Sphagnum jensenii TaxID=128206 RepID=A0ABP0V937_9BRYO
MRPNWNSGIKSMNPNPFELYKDNIYRKIDEFYESVQEDGYRMHLGWSMLGSDCSRQLYYHWHWMKPEQHHARMERIFIEGHKIEKEIRSIFITCGAKFEDNVEETGEQTRVGFLNDHAGGSVDGIFTWPAVGINSRVLLEVKSHNDSSYNQLVKKGVKDAKPRHYIQMCGYGNALGIATALYVARNKNNSAIFLEFVHLPTRVAEEYKRKAEFIILTESVPPKISHRQMNLAFRVYDLANSVGVNTHFAYTDTAYNRTAQVIAWLKASHIRHTRDGYYPWPAGHPQYAIHQQLKAIGVDTIAVVPWSDPLPTVAELVQFAQLADNIRAFEITNEPDDQKDPNWVKKVQALAPIVVRVCVQLGICALAPALVHPESYAQLGTIPGAVGNCHFYPEPRQPETPPYGPNGTYSLKWYEAQSPYGITRITETGYIDTTDRGVAACYLLRAICYAYACGFPYTYIYQLVDTDGYGLVNSQGITPAYTAIRHLLECVADNGANAATFLPKSLCVTAQINGVWNRQPNTLLLQKSNGDYLLIVWSGDEYLAGKSQNVGIGLPSLSSYKVVSYQVISETGADPETLCSGVTTAGTMTVPIGNGITLATIRSATS